MAHRHQRTYESNRRLQEPTFDHSTPLVESQPQHIPPIAMSESEDYRTRSTHRYQKDPGIKNQKQFHSYSPSRFSSDSFSSDSSGSYIEISRHNQERLPGLSDFFSAPFENTKRAKAKTHKKRNRKSFFRFGSNTSSSSVNSDLAYGTGFIRNPKKKGKGQVTEKTKRYIDMSREKFERNSDHEAYIENIHAPYDRSDSERSIESDKERKRRKEKTYRSKKSLRSPKEHASNIATTAGILAIGTGLAKLAKSDNRVSLQNTRKNNHRSQENEFQSLLKPVPSKTFYGLGDDDDDDDDGWESTYDSESESSIDSKLAYGSESQIGWSLFGSKRPRNYSNHQISSKHPKTDGTREKEKESTGPTYTSREIPRSRFKHDDENHIPHHRLDQSKKLQQGPLIKTESEKRSKLLAIPSETYFTTSTGISSSNHGVSQVPKSDSIQLQIVQPQPITPVSQSIYEADKQPPKNNTYDFGNYQPQTHSFPMLVDENHSNKMIGIASNQHIHLTERKRGESSDIVKEDLHQNWERDDIQEEIRRHEAAIIQLQRERLALRKEMESRGKNLDQIKFQMKPNSDRSPKKKNKDRGRKRELDRDENKGIIRDRSRLNKKRDTGWEKIMDPFLYQVFDSSSDESQTSPKIAINPSLKHDQFDYQNSAQESIFPKPVQSLPSSKSNSETARNHLNDNDLGNKTRRKEIRYDIRNDVMSSSEKQPSSKSANATTYIGGEFSTAALEISRESHSDKQKNERRHADQENANNFDLSNTKKNSGFENENPHNFRGQPLWCGVFANENNSNILLHSQLPIRDVPQIFGNKAEIPKVGNITSTESENFDLKMMHSKSYYAPGADLSLDNVNNEANEIQTLHTTSRLAQLGPYDPQALDLKAAPSRPLINLVRPTPSPPSRSEGHEALFESILLSGDRKNNQGLQSNLVNESKAQSKTYSQLPNTPKSVSWGENETKNYEIGFPSENFDQNISKYNLASEKFPESQLDIYFPISNVTNTGKEVTELGKETIPVESRSKEFANSSEKSTNNPPNYWPGEGKECKARGQLYYPQSSVESSTSSLILKAPTSYVPGTLEEDLDFTATVAAGLEKTGFDPEIVISDTDFRHKNLTPSFPVFKVGKHATYAETVSDFETEIPRLEELYDESISKDNQKTDNHAKSEESEKKKSSDANKIILPENLRCDGNEDENEHDSSNLSKKAKTRNIKKKRKSSFNLKGKMAADTTYREGITESQNINNYNTQELFKKRLGYACKDTSQEITRINPPQQNLQLDSPDDISRRIQHQEKDILKCSLSPSNPYSCSKFSEDLSVDNKHDRYSMPFILSDGKKSNADSISISEAKSGINNSLPAGIFNQGKIQDLSITVKSPVSKNHVEYPGMMSTDCVAPENLPASKEIARGKFSSAANNILEKLEPVSAQYFGKPSLIQPDNYDKETDERETLQKELKEQKIYEKDIKELEAQSGDIVESFDNDEHKFSSMLNVKLEKKTKIKKKKKKNIAKAISPAILAGQLPDKGVDVSVGQKYSCTSSEKLSSENSALMDSERSRDVLLHPELQNNINNENYSMLPSEIIVTDSEKYKTLGKPPKLMEQGETIMDRDKHLETKKAEPVRKAGQYLHHIYNEATLEHDKSNIDDEINQRIEVDNISSHFLEHEKAEEPRIFGENDELASDTFKHWHKNDNNENSHDLHDAALNLRVSELQNRKSEPAPPHSGMAKIHEIVRQEDRKELVNKRFVGESEVLELDNLREIQTQVETKELLELDQCSDKLDIGPKNGGDTDRGEKVFLGHESLGFEENRLKASPYFDNKNGQGIQISVSPNIVSVDEYKNKSLEELQNVIELEEFISTDPAVIDQSTSQDIADISHFESIVGTNFSLASNCNLLGEEAKVEKIIDNSVATETLTSFFTPKEFFKNDSAEGIVTCDLAYEKSQENFKGVGLKYNYSPEKSYHGNRLSGIGSISKENDQFEESRKFHQDDDQKFFCKADNDHQNLNLTVTAEKNHNKKYLSDCTSPLYISTGSTDKATGVSYGTELKNENTSPENYKLSSELINMVKNCNEKEFRPPIDPEYGDLLLLPPLSSKPLDFQHKYDLPKLPDSRPNTPENSSLDDRSQNTPRKSGIQASPARLLSQSSIPISLHFGKRANSTPETLASPKLLHPNISLFPFEQKSFKMSRSRARHASWDRATEFQPLYLLEINKQNLAWNNDVENLPKLPESPRRSRSSSQIDLNRKKWSNKEISSDIVLNYPHAENLTSSGSLSFEKSIMGQTEEIDKSEGDSTSLSHDVRSGTNDFTVLPSSFEKNKFHQVDQAEHLSSNLSFDILIQPSGDSISKNDDSLQLIDTTSDIKLLKNQNINDEFTYQIQGNMKDIHGNYHVESATLLKDDDDDELCRMALEKRSNVVSKKSPEITAIIPETIDKNLSISKDEEILETEVLSNLHKALKNENEVTKFSLDDGNLKSMPHFSEEQTENKINKEESGSMSIYNELTLSGIEQDLTEPSINFISDIDNYENLLPEISAGKELNTNTNTQVDTKHNFNFLTVSKSDEDSSVLDIKNMSPENFEYHKVHEREQKLPIMVIPKQSTRKELPQSLLNEKINNEENGSVVSENIRKCGYPESSLVRIHKSEIIEKGNTRDKNLYTTITDNPSGKSGHGIKWYNTVCEIVESPIRNSIYEKEDKNFEKVQQKKNGEVDRKENQRQNDKIVDPSDSKKSQPNNQLENCSILETNLSAKKNEKELGFDSNDASSTHVNIDNDIHDHISEVTESIFNDENCIINVTGTHFAIDKLNNVNENENEEDYLNNLKREERKVKMEPEPLSSIKALKDNRLESSKVLDTNSRKKKKDRKNLTESNIDTSHSEVKKAKKINNHALEQLESLKFNSDDGMIHEKKILVRKEKVGEVEKEFEEEAEVALENEVEESTEKEIEAEVDMEPEMEVEVAVEKDVEEEVEIEMEPEKEVKEVEGVEEVEVEMEPEKEVEGVEVAMEPEVEVEVAVEKYVEEVMEVEMEPEKEVEGVEVAEVAMEPEVEVEVAVEKYVEEEMEVVEVAEVAMEPEKEVEGVEVEMEPEVEPEVEVEVALEKEAEEIVEKSVEESTEKGIEAEVETEPEKEVEVALEKDVENEVEVMEVEMEPEVEPEVEVEVALEKEAEEIVEKSVEESTEKEIEITNEEDVGRETEKELEKESDQKCSEKSCQDVQSDGPLALVSTLGKKTKKKKKNRKSLDISMINKTPILENNENVKYDVASEILKSSITEFEYDPELLKELLNQDKIAESDDKEDKRRPGKERKIHVEEINEDEHPKQKQNKIDLGTRKMSSEDDNVETFVTQSTDLCGKNIEGEIHKELDSTLVKAFSSHVVNEDDLVYNRYKFITAELKDKVDNEKKSFDMIKEKPKFEKNIEEDPKRLEAIINIKNVTADREEHEKVVEPKVSESCQDKQLEDSSIPVITSVKKKKKKKKKCSNPVLNDASLTLVKNDDKISDAILNKADYTVPKTIVDTTIKVEQSAEVTDRLEDGNKIEKNFQERHKKIILIENEMSDRKENEKEVKPIVSETFQDKQLKDSSIPIITSAKKKKNKKNQKRPDSGSTDILFTQILDEKGKNDAIDKILEPLRLEQKKDKSNSKLNREESQICFYDEVRMKDNTQSLMKVNENVNEKDCGIEVERKDHKVDMKRNLGEIHLTNISEEESWKDCTGEHEKLGEENIQQMVLEKSCHDKQLKCSTTFVTNLDRKKKKDNNQEISDKITTIESSTRVNIEIDKQKPISGIAESFTHDIQVDGEVKDSILGVKEDKIDHQKSNEINFVPKVLEMPVKDNLPRNSTAAVTTSGKKNKDNNQKRSDSKSTNALFIQFSTENKIYDAISEISESLMLESKQKVEANIKNLDEVIGSQNLAGSNEMICKKDLEKEVDSKVLGKLHQGLQLKNLDKGEKNKNQKISDRLMTDLPSKKLSTDIKMHKNLPKIYGPLSSETKFYEEVKQKLLSEEGVKEAEKIYREESNEPHKIEDSPKIIEIYEAKPGDKDEEETQLVVSKKAQQNDQNEISNTLKPTSCLMINFQECSWRDLDTTIIESQVEQKISKNKNYDDQLMAINSSMPKTIYHEKIRQELCSGEEVKYTNREMSQQYTQPESSFTPSNALGETKIDELKFDTTILSAVNEVEKNDDLSDTPTRFSPEVVSNSNTKKLNLNDREGVEKILNKKGKIGGNEVEELDKEDKLIAMGKSRERKQVENHSKLLTDSSKPEVLDRLDPIVSDIQLIYSSDRDKKHNFHILPIESSISLPIYERDVCEKSFGEKATSELFTNNENKNIQSITNPHSSQNILSKIPATSKNNSSSFLADFTEIDKNENLFKPVSISNSNPCTEKEISENSLNGTESGEVIESIVSKSPQESHPIDNPKPVKTWEKESKKKKNRKNLDLSTSIPNNLAKIEEDKSYVGKNAPLEAQDTKTNKSPKEVSDNSYQDGFSSISINSEEVESKTCKKTPSLAEDLMKDHLKSYSESSTSMSGIDNQDPCNNNVQSNFYNLNTPLKSEIEVFTQLPISSSSKSLDSDSTLITPISSKTDHLDASISINKKSSFPVENFDKSTTQKIIKSVSDLPTDNHPSPLRSSRSSHFGFSKLPIVVEERNSENVEQNERIIYQTEANNDNLKTGQLSKNISYYNFHDFKLDSIASQKDAYKGNIDSSTILANEIPHLSEKLLLRNYRSFQTIPQEKPKDIRRSSSYSGNLSNKGLVQKRIEKFESSEEICKQNKLGREIVETSLLQKSTREVYTGLNSYEPRTRKPSEDEQGITTAVADVNIKEYSANLDLDIEQRTSDLKFLKLSSKDNNFPGTESRMLDQENLSHSLRRSKPRTSGDLRSLSQHEEKLGPDKPNPPQDKQIPANSAPQPNEGRVRAKEMAEILDGIGEGHMISPRSPTRPHSLRRRQSMKVMDLESKVENLVERNRVLAEEKQNIEQKIKSSIQISLAKKDAEVEALTRRLNFLQEEVSKLTELNEGLNCAASAITQQYSDRNAILESEHTKLSQELEQIRNEHKRLTLNFQNELQSKLSVKDRKIAELHTELDAANQKIREAQKQILLSKGCDLEYLSLKYEDYFENACQKLCQHVQQWVLRFSKYSDMKSCRLTGEIRDDKIVERLDNAILDGSDVDTYLSDRIKRRDVFMSVVMTMIWEYIFTRYLFGMGRDQRQKLKSLEKTLSEVGPASAVHSWRAITLTLLSKRTVFIQQKEQDTQAVVDVIINTLSEILPPPSNFERQIQEQLSRVMNEAVDLSIDMRCQKAEYMMLPPLQPEYDTNGEVLSKVLFNAAVMNERSGNTVSNKELQAQKAIVRIVLFPLVVKRGDDSGQTQQETVICPAQVLIAKPKSLVHRDDEIRSKISMKSNSHTMKSEYSSLGLPSVVE